MQKYGYDAIILGKGTKWQGFMTKIKATRDYLKTINHKYVAFLDCFDAYAFKEGMGMIETFELFNSDIVVSSEVTCFPTVCVKVDKWKNLGPSRYVNSGFYMGLKDKVETMLTAMLESGETDDQRAMCKYIISEPKDVRIALDYKSLLCTTIFFGVFNHDTTKKINSYFVHCPGSSIDFQYRYMALGRYILNKEYEPASSLDNKNLWIATILVIVFAVLFAFFPKTSLILMIVIILIALIFYALTPTALTIYVIEHK